MKKFLGEEGGRGRGFFPNPVFILDFEIELTWDGMVNFHGLILDHFPRLFHSIFAKTPMFYHYFDAQFQPFPSPFSHSQRCESHSMSLRHDPAKYTGQYETLARMTSRLDNVRLKIVRVANPRLGSFEISLKWNHNHFPYNVVRQGGSERGHNFFSRSFLSFFFPEKKT